MKKIFALALVGLLTVAFSSNAVASDTDNTEVVLTVGNYDAPVDVLSVGNTEITFNIVPVATDFVNYVAVDSVNYTNEGGFTAVAVVLKFSTHGFAITNEYTELDLPELIPLTNYVRDYNSTFGSNEPELYEQIATNVGKLTSRTY